MAIPDKVKVGPGGIIQAPDKPKEDPVEAFPTFAEASKGYKEELRRHLISMYSTRHRDPAWWRQVHPAVVHILKD